MRATRSALLIGAGAVLALVTAACGSGSGAPDTATPTASATSSASAAVIPDGEFTAAPDGVVNEDTGEVVGDHVVPEWDAQSREAVTRTAEKAMTAFARPGMAADQWWDELEPLLSSAAQLDYSYTDPANVPASAVTGPGTLVDDSSAYLGYVEVPTDAGTYTVVLSRLDGAAPWLVERLAPPDGQG